MVQVVPTFKRAGFVLRGRFAAPQDEVVGSYVTFFIPNNPSRLNMRTADEASASKAYNFTYSLRSLAAHELVTVV
jgi:hypothetical protein